MTLQHITAAALWIALTKYHYNRRGRCRKAKFVFKVRSRTINVSNYQKTARKRIEAAFSILHRIPHLKTLELYFEAHYVESPSYLSFLWDGKVTTHSHQWDIVYALGRNRNPLPELQSLIFSGWLHAPNFASFFDEAPIAWLTASLRHLSLSLPRGCLGADEWEARVQYWKQVAVRRVLRPAANLESLKITRHQSSEWPEEQCLDISQLPTYPRLAALSLKNIIWEEGTIGEGNVVTPFPLEDFIVHHSKTLKKLELRNCSILINKGFETPLSYWADIYKRLAEALTKLTELEVEFDIKRYKKPYVRFVFNSYSPIESLEGAERDALALAEFKAVVKSQGMASTARPNDG